MLSMCVAHEPISPRAYAKTARITRLEVSLNQI